MKEVQNLMLRNAWLPNQVPPRTRRREDTQGEFWDEENINPVSALVRESIQNSLDEIDDLSKPVRMTFTLGLQSTELNEKYFSKLAPHVNAALKPPVDLFSLESKFLIIEDFNTLGMEGSTREIKPSIRDAEKKNLGRSESGHKDSFWSFVWVSGSTSKNNSRNRGSRGIGKIVFNVNSAIRSYMVFSSRRSEAAPEGDLNILFGHSLLMYHDFEGIEYNPDIYWMVELGQDKKSSVPSCNLAEINEFIEDWGLTRKPDELGSSILVPFCDANLTTKRLVQTIIRDYFIEILSGKFICEVRDRANAPTTINSKTLIDLIENLDEDLQNDVTKNAVELKLICEMYRDYLEDNTLKVSHFKIGMSESSPNNWSEVQISDVEQKNLLGLLEQGKTIAFEVETLVPGSMRDNLKENSSTHAFRVLLKQEIDISSGTIFTREGILIPAANKKSILKDLISIVSIDTTLSGRLAVFLRSSEGAAHDKWKPEAKNIQGIYSPVKEVRKLLDFVKNSPERIWRIIQGAEETHDDEGLSRYFPMGQDPIKQRIGTVTSESGAIFEPDKTPTVHLVALRNRNDVSKAQLKWTTQNITQASFEIFELEKNGPKFASGLSEMKHDVSGLLTQQKYKFQVQVSDGVNIYSSNIASIKPEIAPKISAAAVKTKSGFEINSKYLALTIGTKLQIEVAYRSRGSNSIGKWSVEDFDLKSKLQKHRGVVITHSENRINLEIVDSNFSAVWENFDPIRDLVVESHLVRD